MLASRCSADERTGFIDAKEVQFALSALGWYPEKAKVQKLLEKAKKKSHATLSYDDFLDVARPLLLEQRERERMEHAFRLFSGGKDRITAADLKRVAETCGEELDSEELHEMIGCADPTARGFVTLDDFLRLTVDQ